MILGTAGHIDHGKTTLVRALTGVDTDRLPEEKRRGITIDLGFAPLILDGVGRLGIVDVPGHEAFVRTMVAGATGIDLALLVIAADAGVMPQTREHLSILSLLGVRNGVVALTKRDLVDADWLALVEEDVRETLEGSALAGAPIVPVSSTTGEGLDALRLALAGAARAVPSRGAEDLFRLPIDRAFTVKGTGTVVTGTVWTGSLARDATLRLFPSGAAVRVRGLHAHGQVVDRVHAGDRAAIALAGTELEQVGRGAVLVQGDAWAASRVLRADVHVLERLPVSIGPRTRMRFHLGTNDVAARLVVREGTLSAGAPVSARVVLDEPIVARAGDRFVLRAASPAETIGGGVVTDPAAPLRARPWPVGDASAEARLERLMDEGGSAGVDTRVLAVRLGLDPAAVGSLLSSASGWRVESRMLSAATRASLGDLLLATLRSWHGEHPLEPGAPLQWIRSKLGAPDDVASALVAAEQEAGRVRVDQACVALAGFAPELSAQMRSLHDAMLSRLEDAGVEPPAIEELAAALSTSPATVATLARMLQRDGTLVAVEPNRYYTRGAVAALQEKMRGGMEPGRDYAPTDIRDLLGLTRKFLIPFLEYCDREGYTDRNGLGRRIRGHLTPPVG